MQPLNIYKPTTTEYPEIMALWEASVRATHHFLSEDDIQFYKPLVSTYLPMLDLYGVKHHDTIAGFMGISDGMVQALFIHPDAMGKGAGKQLLNYAIHQMQINKVDVNEQNHQAVGFYQHMGFKVTGRSEVDGTGKPYPILSMQLS
jgi:putative acetyltransferase